jgi:GTPase SAR1 family protein
MKSNAEVLEHGKTAELAQFLKGIRYLKFDLLNGNLTEYLNQIKDLKISENNLEQILRILFHNFGIEIILEKISSDIYEMTEKTISLGQIMALMHKVLGFTLSSTERSQLHELRKKIRRYGKFLAYFGEWGKRFDFLFKVLIFGLTEEDSNNLEYFADKAEIQAGKNNIGVEFYTKDIEVFKKSLIRLQLWEISKQNQFGSIRSQYYKGAAAAMAFFYADTKGSFNLLAQFLQELKEKTDLKFSSRKQKEITINMPIVIVGMRAPSKDQYDQASSLAREINARYLEMDGINYESMDDLFKYITSHLTLSL